MPTAHLIHGFLGAGKSTLARRLEREHDAVRFSPDERMVERHGIDPPAEKFAGNLEAIYAEINAQWPRVLASGRDVVLDFGFWARAERDAARRHATEVGATVRLYFVRCSEATARARCRVRNATLAGSLYIADNTFDILKARFEPLGPDEAHEVVDTESD